MDPKSLWSWEMRPISSCWKFDADFENASRICPMHTVIDIRSLKVLILPYFTEQTPFIPIPRVVARAGLNQTESHFSSRVFSRLVKATRAMRMKSVLCQWNATQTRLKTDFATQTKPATHILFILLWPVSLHKRYKSDKNDICRWRI